MMNCYLIHFHAPLGDTSNPRGIAQHYIGCTDDLEKRLARHRAGNGSALMTAVKKAGVEWTVVRVWENADWETEKKLKARHRPADFCPVCKGEIE